MGSLGTRAARSLHSMRRLDIENGARRRSSAGKGKAILGADMARGERVFRERGAVGERLTSCGLLSEGTSCGAVGAAGLFQAALLSVVSACAAS